MITITQTMRVIYEARFFVMATDAFDVYHPVCIQVDFADADSAHAYLKLIEPLCVAEYSSARAENLKVVENVFTIGQRMIYQRAFLHHIDGVYEVVTTQRKLARPDDALPLYSGFEPMISTKSRSER